MNNAQNLKEDLKSVGITVDSDGEALFNTSSPEESRLLFALLQINLTLREILRAIREKE